LVQGTYPAGTQHNVCTTLLQRCFTVLTS